jgi:hypothetical protein
LAYAKICLFERINPQRKSERVGFEQNYSFYSSDIKIELVESRAALESWLRSRVQIIPQPGTVISLW